MGFIGRFLKQPIFGGMGMYFVVWTAADISQQEFISKVKEYDKFKTLRSATVGGFVIAPILFTWLRIAEWLVPGTQLKNVLKKIVLEQSLFGPVVISSFYAASGVLEGKTYPEIREEWRDKFIPTWKTGAQFWPFMQLINFTFVPLHRRIYFVCAASFMWSNYLCYMKVKNFPHPDLSEEIVVDITEPLEPDDKEDVNKDKVKDNTVSFTSTAGTKGADVKLSVKPREETITGEKDCKQPVVSTVS
ncbi:unnamed protein product [Owenia fusiformis]|uniref:Uncharacterized protein n=1 Tax=Owenia fusiformis TaxID=6347 RepID=A0A8J1Y882_OWEFU|nr:unnamed protein product [Owenia fusiformis]